MDQSTQNMVTQKAKENSPIDEEFEMIFAGCSSLYERLGTLESRLGTVLTPTPATDNSTSAVSTPNRGGSDTVFKLHEINSRLAGMENFIDSVSRRLEL